MSRVLEVGEWSREVIPFHAPTPDDLRLLGALDDERGRRLEHRWLRTGDLEIRTTSWVGVIRLSDVTIHIRPKFAGHELGVVRMLSYAGGYRALKRAPGRRALEVDGIGLLDLLCHLLADEVDLVLRDGLLHDYSEQEESLPALRGSLRFKDQATRRFGQLDVLECRFDEFHADVIENQLLRTGLGVAARICGTRSITRRLRRLESVVAELASVGPTDTGFYRERLTYGRRNERYRTAHELSLLVMERLGVEDLYGSGPTDSFAFLIDMNDVFESFVTAAIREAFTGERWSVSSQRRETSVIRNRTTGKRYASIIPDLVLSDGRVQVPFDCKYKLYGEGGQRISSADVYQTFLYAFAFAGASSNGAKAGIIFPSRETTTSPHLEIRQVDGPTSAHLTGIAVDLLTMQRSLDDPEKWAGVLADVRRAMMEVLNGDRVA